MIKGKQWAGVIVPGQPRSGQDGAIEAGQYALAVSPDLVALVGRYLGL